MEEGWYGIRSPSARLGYTLAGLIGLVIPSVLCAWVTTVSQFSARTEVGDAGAEAPASWAILVAALLLLTPIHELIHAIWHPRLGFSPKTVLVIWPTKLRFGLYYEGCMTRGRWLMMRIAPLLLLSVVPAGLLVLFGYVPAPFALEVFLQVLMLANAIGSGGDVLAVVWVLFQVPSEAWICFRGGKAYWRLAPLSSENVPSWTMHA